MDLKDTSHDNRKLEDHFGAKVEAEGWEGQELEVKSDPLVDAGTGKPLVIRIFDFKLNPALKRKEFPKNKQDVFNSHARQIKDFLWKDGLVAREDVSPRVQFSKKEMKYRIFVLCEARYGMMWNDKPKTLQELK